MIEEVRETRKQLMQKIIPSYEGEVWCISKHLLASSMRLMEVGTKQQSLGHKDESYKLFNQAYELYCLFWGLNMNMLNVDDVKWIEDSSESLKKITSKLESSAAAVVDAKKTEGDKPQGRLAKMKAFVRKAVDCCIE